MKITIATRAVAAAMPPQSQPQGGVDAEMASGFVTGGVKDWVESAQRVWQRLPPDPRIRCSTSLRSAPSAPVGMRDRISVQPWFPGG